MRLTGKSRRLLLFLALYLAFSVIAGIFLADGTLHPSRRALTPEAESNMRGISHSLDSDLDDVSIITPDATTLRAWTIRPHHSNGNAVILLHGLADNRMGTAGYAQLLLAHGFIVLMPDARAHGSSGGQLASYGLLERNDIHQWFNFLAAQFHPHCIFGLGESMGAAELLQSLRVEPHFCAVVAESSFSTFREIAYDRMGQPFHLGPWLGRTFLRPVVEFALLRARFKYHLDLQQASPDNSVAVTRIPVFLIHGQLDSNIPIRHSLRIRLRNPSVFLWEVSNADHCGAIAVAPQEFEQRLLAWFSPKSGNPRQSNQLQLFLTTDNCFLHFLCNRCGQSAEPFPWIPLLPPSNQPNPALHAPHLHSFEITCHPRKFVKTRGNHFPQLHQKY